MAQDFAITINQVQLTKKMSNTTDTDNNCNKAHPAENAGTKSCAFWFGPGQKIS